MTYKRNEGMHTDRAVIVERILKALSHYSYTDGLRKAAIGYCAYPDYDFKRPQGAAFSVARVVRELQNEGMVCTCKNVMEYMLTSKGFKELENLTD